MHFDKARIHWLFTLGGICLVMGMLLAVQVRSNPPQERLLLSRLESTSGGPVGALNQFLAATQRQVEDQAQEIETLRKQVTEYEQAALRERDIAKPLAEQLTSAKITLGLVAVNGPGITLELDDSKLLLGDAQSEELKGVLLVHDFDLLQIANELWAAGAEAVSLNGQRIVGGTPIRCVGPATQINSVPIAAPYRFIALGDPDTLASSLNMPGGVLERLRSLKFPVNLVKEESLTVPAIPAAKKFQYATPVENTAAQSAANKNLRR